MNINGTGRYGQIFALVFEFTSYHLQISIYIVFTTRDSHWLLVLFTVVRNGPDMILSILVITASLCLTPIRSEHDCKNYSNANLSDYVYTVCTGTNVTTLNTSRQFCQDITKDGDVVTFPNVDEYNFIITQINNTVNRDTFKYSPGFYQKMNSSNKYSPHTGEFFWIDDPTTVITNESSTYWEPFNKFITEFDNLEDEKEISTFSLNLDGEFKHLSTVALALDGIDSLNGDIICVQKRSNETSLPSTTITTTSMTTRTDGETTRTSSTHSRAPSTRLLLTHLQHGYYSRLSSTTDITSASTVSRSNNAGSSSASNATEPAQQGSNSSKMECGITLVAVTFVHVFWWIR